MELTRVDVTVAQDHLRDDPYSKALLEWFAGADFYFIIGHVHESVRGMDVVELYEDLSALTSYKGFPEHSQLNCPMFSQDKFEYIRACPEICIPTLRISLPLNVDGPITRSTLETMIGIDAFGCELSIYEFMMVSSALYCCLF